MSKSFLAQEDGRYKFVGVEVHHRSGMIHARCKYLVDNQVRYSDGVGSDPIEAIENAHAKLAEALGLA